MSNQRHGRVTELFLEAVKLAPEERKDFLDEACADDPQLRAEVESLVARDQGPTAVDEPLTDAFTDFGPQPHKKNPDAGR